MTELAALEAAYTGARRVIEAYLAAPVEQRAAAIAQLRPRSADFRAVFRPEHAAEAAERGYLALWANMPIWPVPPEPGVVVHAATSEALTSNAREAQPFPGGYHEIACWLRPGVIWIAWSITSAARGPATLYDGLVEVEPGRWAWFPRPWKVLPKPLAPTLWWDD